MSGKLDSPIMLTAQAAKLVSMAQSAIVEAESGDFCAGAKRGIADGALCLLKQAEALDIQSGSERASKRILSSDLFNRIASILGD